MQFQGEAKFASIAASGHCSRKMTVSGSGVSIAAIAPKSTCREIKAYESGRIMAEFRGVTPTQRDELSEKLGERITTSESPWLSNLLVVFNTGKKPFDDARVRRALSLAIDRWGAAERLQGSTFLKYVGGLMRPGANLAMSEAELTSLPGFSHDILASRAEAKRLLAEAGV